MPDENITIFYWKKEVFHLFNKFFFIIDFFRLNESLIIFPISLGISHLIILLD